MLDTMMTRDAFQTALSMARDLGHDSAGTVGYGVLHLLGPDGTSKKLVPFANLITDTGDLYHADKVITGIAPANAVAPTAVTGMQVGSGGATAAAKSGAGAAMVTFIAGQAFDATYPMATNLGAGLGVEAVYKTTYAAGVATGTVSEATITNGAVGTASLAANTISRITFAGIAVAAADSLAITWNHKFLGA